MSKKPELSIVILNFNTQDLLKDCLESLQKVKGEVNFEVIVVDNASTDDSIQMVKKEYDWVKVLENEKNLGFAAGNNVAREHINGKYVLFLNTDTVVYPGVLKESLAYLKEHPEVGALSCKQVLKNGKLDEDSRRSFPTPWVAFSHFSRLDRLFPNSKFFAKYWYGYLPEDKTHEVDVLQGAFFLTTIKVLEEVDWMDEDYYLDGEDIELSWRIKKLGKKLVYYPKVKILHLKGATKGKNKNLSKRPGIVERFKYAMRGVDSMEIFYRKHLWKRYPFVINVLVILGIKGMKVIRIFKRVIF